MALSIYVRMPTGMVLFRQPYCCDFMGAACLLNSLSLCIDFGTLSSRHNVLIWMPSRKLRMSSPLALNRPTLPQKSKKQEQMKLIETHSLSRNREQNIPKSQIQLKVENAASSLRGLPGSPHKPQLGVRPDNLELQK